MEKTMIMSEKALQNDKELGVPLVKVNEIIRDDEFNCRGMIYDSDVLSLAKDIAENGLQQPITISPFEGKYKILTGHRRWTAYKVNGAELIPCIIREGLSEDQKRMMNIKENLQREDLNILQEANAIKYWLDLNYSAKEISDKIGKTVTWVTIRTIILSFPTKVQKWCSQGYIKGRDIMSLNRYRHNPQHLVEVAAKVMNLRLAKQPNAVNKVLRRETEPTDRRERSRAEMEEMMEIIRRYLCNRTADNLVYSKEVISPQGNCFGTAALAWAAGHTDNAELFDSLESVCAAHEIVFLRPKGYKRKD